jgi:hypothetical protein
LLGARLDPLSITTTDRSTSSSSSLPTMPPYWTSESSSSVFDLLAGAMNFCLIAESQPQQRPEGGWFDFLCFLASS